MRTKSALALLFAVPQVAAFPWVPSVAGVDSTLMHQNEKRQTTFPNGPGSLKNCPVNHNHKPAAPITNQYPYNNARNGLPGNQKGGFLVPAKGDTAHYFVAPDYSKDVRGPCPGLNTLANHNFLAHDGITTFNELVDAQQNVYNVGYDLAVLLAVLGLTTTDGDPITMKLSIGCDATPRTSYNPILSGSEPGLDGHNKFEGDTSLTRNDYFLGKGDNFKMNGTLFGMMTATTGGNYSFDQLAEYRYQRYQQSMAENSNFYFGPFSLLLFGAASFLYELFPSGTRNFNADYFTIRHFFGAEKNADGTYSFNGKEQLPLNWTNRVTPYNSMDVGNQIFSMYLAHPVLFGGNTGNGQFDVINGNGIQNGKLNATSGADVLCLLYQLSTERTPTSLNGFLTPTIDAIEFAVGKLGPAYANLGCADPLT